MRPSVLVVEDSRTVRLHLRDTFEHAGFLPTLCESLREARDEMARRPFDLVVLDIGLPDGDGFDLLREIRARPETASLPVMMLSAGAEATDRVRGLRIGADEFVGKPYDPAYVTSRARMLVERRQPAVARTGPVVLVIEDSATYATAIRAALEGEGIETEVAATAEAGMQALFDVRPDAVVVDGRLPGIDGAEVIRRMRLDAAVRATPCLLLTASAESADEVRALEAGADAFLQKTNDTAPIVARVRALLRGAGERRSLEPAATTIGPKRIVLVDEGDSALAESLRAPEYDVATARSPGEALELLALQGASAIVLATRAPPERLASFCATLREMPGLRDLPVLLFADGDMVAALRAGIDDCVPPGAGVEVLRAHVLAHMRRRQVEDETRQMIRAQLEAASARALAQANEALRKAQAENEEYAKFLVHDLKNPLSAISSHAQFLVRRRDLPEDAVDSARQIVDATRRLSRMVMNVLDLARAEEGRLVAAPGRIDARELLDQIVRDHERRAADRGHELAVVVQGNPAIAGDPDLLRRALGNLVENAMKYAPPQTTIRLEAALAGDATELRVIDSGPGVPAGMRERIFDKYVRLETGADPSARQSRGLGLAFCRLVAEVHGGSIHVEPASGGGASFVLRIRSATDPATEG